MIKDHSHRTAATLATSLFGLLLIIAPNQASGENAPATILQDIAADADLKNATLLVSDSTEFQPFGGRAIIARGSSVQEVVEYDGADHMSNEIYGISRPNQTYAHSSGTQILPIGPKPEMQEFDPGQDPPSTHAPRNHFHPDPEAEPEVVPVRENGEVDLGTERVLPPTTSWLDTHCVPIGSQYAVLAVHVYDPYNDASTPLDDVRTLDPITKIREEVQAADRGISQSHDTFKQHMKIACRTLAGGGWDQIEVVSYPVPSAAEKSAPFDGGISCAETLGWMEQTFWGRNAANQGKYNRFIWFLDQSLAGNTCSFGGSDSGAHGNVTKGIGNPNNSTYGQTSVDYGDWGALGVSNRSVNVVMQEFHHSLGLVSTQSDGHCCAGHTRDHPDFMGGAYCYNNSFGADCTDGQEIRINCGTSLPAGLTYRDTYVDCGRDTYWSPNAGTNNPLCQEYNLAWDSLYYHQRATPTVGCR